MKLSCRIGWHNWQVAGVDHDARPPVEHLACRECDETALNFYDGPQRT